LTVRFAMVAMIKSPGLIGTIPMALARGAGSRRHRNIVTGNPERG
jgi:hypothetical protein